MLSEQVFSKCKVLLETIQYALQFQASHGAGGGHAALSKLNKSKDAMEKFANRIQGDTLFCKLFQFAVCISREGLHDHLMDIMGWSQQIQEHGHDGTGEKLKPPPQESKN